MRRAGRGLARALETASRASAPRASARPFVERVETAPRSAHSRDEVFSRARAFSSVPSTSERSNAASPAPSDRTSASEVPEKILAFAVRQSGPTLMFRTLNEILGKAALNETWGQTMRARWRRTYLGPTASTIKLNRRETRQVWKSARSAVYNMKGKLLVVFWKSGGWTFAATYVTGFMVTLALAVPITVMGISGFMVVAKVLGAGELARGAIEFVFSAMERTTGVERELSIFVPIAFVGHRMQYYTLPVILFAYEEIRHFSIRLRSLARWLR